MTAVVAADTTVPRAQRAVHYYSKYPTMIYPRTVLKTHQPENISFLVKPDLSSPIGKIACELSKWKAANPSFLNFC